jgi:two-component system sensor histidine kinase KdpD
MGENEFAVANWVLENKKPAGWSTSTLSAAPCLCLPMRGNSGLVGVLALYPGVKQGPLSLDQENFLDTMITQVSLALERLRFSEAAHSAQLYETSERLHQTLLNSISHELRTPLTVIIGSATSLAEKQSPPEYVGAIAKELLGASDRLNRVIENLLDMSRLNSGVMALKLEWHDLQDLMGATVQKLGRNLAQHKFEVEIQPNLPPVLVDFRLLEHALANLILNAAAYSPAGTAIRVVIQLGSPKLLLISVEDQGPGIPAADREKIFEKFYRVPGTPAGGTGLGLSIVKSIVEVHKGRVYVEDAGLGSKFVIEIPVAEAPPMPAGSRD